jgi:hypothetical protein
MDTIRKQTENSDVEFQEKESKKTAEYFEEARSNALSFLSNEIVLRPNDQFLRSWPPFVSRPIPHIQSPVTFTNLTSCAAEQMRGLRAVEAQR